MKKIKLYLDTCCYNRPFDNQSDEQIHLEAEAVITIIKLFLKNEIDISGSEVIDFEISKIPDQIKRVKVNEFSLLIQSKLLIDEAVEQHALDLEKLGFKAFDALHIAISVQNKLEYFVTTDKKLINISKGINYLPIKVINPLLFIKVYFYAD